jgi:signal transduction histidine kinase
MRFGMADYLQTYGILLLFGLTTLALGLVVGFLQPRTTQARVFLLHTFIAGLYPVTAVFLHHPGFPLLGRLCLIAECLAPAAFVHLALVFPAERRFAGLGRWPVLLPYAVSVILAVFVLRGFAASPPDIAALHAGYLYFAACLLFFVVMMLVSYVENRDRNARARIKAVVPGAVVAAGVQALFFIDNGLTGRSLPVQFGLLTPIPYYAAIAYAIAKHDLFDVDRVVRQSFIYATLSLVIVAGYALLLVVPVRLFPPLAANQTLLSIAFLIVLAFALDPLRRGVQALVDRAFYRARFDYQQTIGELSEVMTTLLDLNEVAVQVTRVVTNAMQLESTALGVARRGDDAGSIWWRDAAGHFERRDLPLAAADLAPVAASDVLPAESFWAVIGDTPEADRLRSEVNAALVLPLTVRNEVIGALVLGAKRSGHAFNSFDVDLLRTLANQTAIAVENARSYQALADLTRNLDAKVREQTAALHSANDALSRAYDELKSAQAQLVQSEKMASLGQLVAGVAHELNNPASFVHGGLANLEEYFRASAEILRVYERLPITDPAVQQRLAAARRESHLDYLEREVPELLRICAEGSERIKRIVDDLRVFVRADRGDHAPTDIVAGIESTIRLLGDRLQRRQIAVVKQYGVLPLLNAHAGQLNQVWMNVLSNSIDAVESQAEPEIHVATRMCTADDGEKGRWVEVRIRDNGPGIAAQVRDRIFEPFFTTKPIGRGTGLGLSIVYGAVKSHAGTVTVDSEPGQGTTVTVRLPLVERGEP